MSLYGTKVHFCCLRWQRRAGASVTGTYSSVRLKEKHFVWLTKTQVATRRADARRRELRDGMKWNYTDAQWSPVWGPPPLASARLTFCSSGWYLFLFFSSFLNTSETISNYIEQAIVKQPNPRNSLLEFLGFGARCLSCCIKAAVCVVFPGRLLCFFNFVTEHCDTTIICLKKLPKPK